MPKKSSKAAFGSEPPTGEVPYDPATYAKDSELELLAREARADQGTIKRGIIPMRVASEVDVEWMSLDADARRFMAEVDGLRSASKIFEALGMGAKDGFAVLERLLADGLISLRH